MAELNPTHSRDKSCIPNGVRGECGNIFYIHRLAKLYLISSYLEIRKLKCLVEV